MPSVGIYKTEGRRDWTSKGPQKHTVTAQASGLNRPALGHAETQSCLSEASGGYQGGLCVPKPGEHLGKLEDPPTPPPSEACLETPSRWWHPSIRERGSGWETVPEGFLFRKAETLSVESSDQC